MQKISLNAYLMFEGNCREAMGFYQKVFGGDLNLMTYGDMDGSCPDATKNNVMHGQLMGGEAELMGADEPQGANLGTGKIQLALSGSDEPKLRKMFEALSEGGKIQVPLDKQMWGDLFGAFVDKYGVGWMVNIGMAKPE
ncbi:MAG: VOC family protein [Taibaiella sp.]|jgi:PhnB protein